MNDKKKILIVDDDPAYIEIQRTILESNGYYVDEAGSSQEAVNKINNEQFDLIILDLMMEDKDSGFTLAYKLKGDKTQKQIPILMVSSATEKTGFKFKMPRDQDWMKVDDYMEKPPKPKELLARIEKMIK